MGENRGMKAHHLITVALVTLSAVACGGGLHKKAYANSSSFSIGDGDEKRLLLEDEKGDIALHIALMRGNAEAAQILLKRAGSWQLERVNKKGFSPLHYAFHIEPEYFDESELTEAGMKDLLERKKRTAELLLQRPGGPSAMAGQFGRRTGQVDNFTALSLGIRTFREDPAFLKRMLTADGGLLTTKDASGDTNRLRMATTAMGASVQAIELAAELRIKLNNFDNDGYTAIHTAVMFDCIPCVDLLLKRGASVNAQELTYFGGSPLVKTGLPLDYAQSDPMKDFLKKKGAKNSKYPVPRYERVRVKFADGKPR